MIFKRLMLLAAAGGAGTVLRYALSTITNKALGTSYPYGTTLVNLLGCFAMGVILAFFESRAHLSGEMKTIILVGFVGAFTTFSTYIFETQAFMKNADWHYAALNFLLQNLLGIAVLIAGLKLGEKAF